MDALKPTAAHTPRPSKVSAVSERDKLHLVMQVADEVARTHGVADPHELWGAGWLGIAVAEAREDKRTGGLMPFLRVNVWGAMVNSLKNKKNCPINLPL